MGERASELNPPTDRDQLDPEQGSEIERVDVVEGDDEIDVTVMEIERTRADMSDTIDAIQERLSPQRLKDEARTLAGDARETIRDEARSLVADAKETVREATIGRVEQMASSASTAAKRTGNGLMDTIRQNPIPAAIAGISIGWLFMKSRSSDSSSDDRYRSYRYRPNEWEDSGYASGYDDYSDGDDRSGRSVRRRAGDMAGSVADSAKGAAGSVGDTAKGAAGSVSDAAKGVAGSVGDAASSMTDKAGSLASSAADSAGSMINTTQRRVRRAPDQLSRLVQDNPIAAAGAAIAVGAAIGLMLPETDQESRMMGPARDRFMEQTRGVFDDTKEKLQHVVDEAQGAAKEEAKAQKLTA